MLEPLQLWLGQARHDEQHQVGARGASLKNLVFVADEFLAQHRDINRGTHRAQIIERSQKFAFFGQHTDRRSTALFVLASQLRRIRDTGETPP